MLQDDRENLELERLQKEVRKIAVETKKLLTEERKLRWETNLYPFAVMGGWVVALVAVAGLSLKF